MKISQAIKLRLALLTITRDRARSSVCILTIMAGILSLCLFEGFNSGALWTYQERVVHTRLGHLQIERKVDPSVLTTDAEARRIQNADGLEKKILMQPDVVGVFPRVRLSALLVNDQANVPIIVEGVDAERENRFFTELEYVSGRPLSGESDEIIVGVGAAEALGLKVGSRVTLMGTTVRGSLNAVDLVVAGTFSGGVKEFDESFVRIPLKTAQNLMDFNGVSTLVVGLNDSRNLGTAIASIGGQVLGSGELTMRDFRQVDEVYYGHSVDWLKAQFFFIRLIILLIVIFGIINTVNISIFERTAEIGTYRAMGFSKAFVQGQILREYLFMGAIGGLLGILFSFALAKFALSGGVPMPPSPGATRGLNVILRMEPWMLASNFGLAILCSYIATIFPARRAVRIPIIEALGHRL